jgi:hypothetical protein
MRTRAALALAAAAVPALAAHAGTPARSPGLRVVDRTPVTVRATGFAPGERVGVRLAARGRAWTRRSAAGEAGSLTIRFRVSLGRCDRYTLQAFGSAGSRARLLPTRPFPACVSTS